MHASDAGGFCSAFCGRCTIPKYLRYSSMSTCDENTIMVEQKYYSILQLSTCVCFAFSLQVSSSLIN